MPNHIQGLFCAKLKNPDQLAQLPHLRGFFFLKQAPEVRAVQPTKLRKGFHFHELITVTEEALAEAREVATKSILGGQPVVTMTSKF